MSYAYQVCPECFGLIRHEVKKDNGGNGKTFHDMEPLDTSKAHLLRITPPQLLKANVPDRVKVDVDKMKKAKEYFNKLKKSRNMGKIPNHSDEVLQDYSIQASGLLD